MTVFSALSIFENIKFNWFGDSG